MNTNIYLSNRIAPVTHKFAHFIFSECAVHPKCWDIALVVGETSATHEKDDRAMHNFFDFQHASARKLILIDCKRSFASVYCLDCMDLCNRVTCVRSLTMVKYKIDVKMCEIFYFAMIRHWTRLHLILLSTFICGGQFFRKKCHRRDCNALKRVCGIYLCTYAPELHTHIQTHTHRSAGPQQSIQFIYWLIFILSFFFYSFLYSSRNGSASRYFLIWVSYFVPESCTA